MGFFWRGLPGFLGFFHLVSCFMRVWVGVFGC